jgi:hypothetical protein
MTTKSESESPIAARVRAASSLLAREPRAPAIKPMDGALIVTPAADAP